MLKTKVSFFLAAGTIHCTIHSFSSDPSNATKNTGLCISLLGKVPIEII